MNFSALFLALLSVLSVSAKTFNVAVGDNNGLVYNPSSISGAVAGDQIIFTLYVNMFILLMRGIT